MALSLKEREIRLELDKTFRPIFEEHQHEGGLSYGMLRNELRSSHLPRRKIDKFLKSADQDNDQRITYDEFVIQLTYEDTSTYRRLTRGQKALNQAVRVVAPQKQRTRVVHQDEMDGYNWGEENVDVYIEAYTCCPPPIFIPLITLSQIGVFIYYAIVLNNDSDPYNDVNAQKGCPFKTPLIYSPYRRIEAWRFLTYMFLHNGYIHLIFNCLMQLVLGSLLELVHKFWRVGLVYLLGVICGSLAHSVFDSFTYLVGASGGCYALIGAHFASVIINWREMQKDWLKNPINFFSSGVFSLVILLLLAGGDTGLAVYNRYFGDMVKKVGIAAHGGGFAAGILMGIPILRNLRVEKWEKVLFWVCLVIYLLFVAAAVLFNGFCSNASPPICPKTNWGKA